MRAPLTGMFATIWPRVWRHTYRSTVPWADFRKRLKSAPAAA